MLIAGADKATPVEESLALADRLRAKGADVETHVFDGAPHSFFDRSFGEHRQACEDAWRFLLLLDRQTAIGRCRSPAARSDRTAGRRARAGGSRG